MSVSSVNAEPRMLHRQRKHAPLPHHKRRTTRTSDTQSHAFDTSGNHQNPNSGNHQNPNSITTNIANHLTSCPITFVCHDASLRDNPKSHEQKDEGSPSWRPPSTGHLSPYGTHDQSSRGLLEHVCAKQARSSA